MSRTNRNTSCNRTKSSGGRKFDKRTLTANTWKQDRSIRKRTEDARTRNQIKKAQEWSSKAKPIKAKKSTKKTKSSTPSFGLILIGIVLVGGLNMFSNFNNTDTETIEQVNYN